MKAARRAFIVKGSQAVLLGTAIAATRHSTALAQAPVHVAKTGLTLLTGERSGATRPEFEYPIPLKDARALLQLRTGRLIWWRRHVVKACLAKVEIDVFRGSTAAWSWQRSNCRPGALGSNAWTGCGRDVTDGSAATSPISRSREFAGTLPPGGTAG